MNPQRRPPGHPDWCAADHQCGLGEHRADPVTITTPGAGTLTLTRIGTAAGDGWAEVRLSVRLAESEPATRAQLAALLSHLRTLIGPSRRPHRRAA